INLDNGPRAKNPLGQDARVRQALELSIDRGALNQVVFNGLFQPGNQWVPPGNSYYVKSLPIPERDVAKAKQLLAAANMPHPSITMTVPTIPETLQAAQVIQSMAAESGFDIKIQATEFASSLDLSVKGDYEAYLIGWSGRTDPDGNIYNFVSCKAPPALNTGHYCNPDLDRELDAARQAGDPATALAGEDRDPAVIAFIRQKYHLDEPLPVRYALWVKGVVQGDLGESIRIRRPVLDLIAEKLPVTGELALIAVLISLCIGIP